MIVGTSYELPDLVNWANVQVSLICMVGVAEGHFLLKLDLAIKTFSGTATLACDNSINLK
jgi:hypothetical protein